MNVEPTSSASVSMSANGGDATLTQMDNGLTIIIREDHSAPVVSVQAWCQAGSIHEGNWLGAGMSHALEHMLFKGTATRPGSMIDQEVQEAGGYMNAYTSFDRTVFHIDVPTTGGRVALDILCDVMQHATLPDQELEKEKQVILREMDMNSDDPGRRASRRLFETAYTRSPLRLTVIGYPDIFNRLQPQDLRDYYRSQYAPNNVFFVVVGDIVAGEVLEQIRQAYREAKAQPRPAVAIPEEPRQMAPREVEEEAPIELAYLHYAWHIPDLRHPDAPALDVLAAVLGNGRSSILYSEVRQKLGLVNSVDAWTYSPAGGGLFGFSVTAEADKLEPAKRALLEILEKVRETELESAQLQKAVKQFIAGTLATRKTMQGQAQDLGSSWLMVSDLGFSARYLNAVRRVTAADILRVARQHLTPENRTLYCLAPNGTLKKAPVALAQGKTHKVRKHVLSNGLRVLIREDHRLPFVEFRAVFKGGVLAETPANSGLTLLTGRMLLKGTRSRSADQIALELEAVGGHLDSYGGNNSFGVNAEVMSEDLSKGIEMVADVILQPTFPDDALAREREVQLASIRAQNDQILQIAFKRMRRELFNASGYGLDVLGSEESVKGITAEQLAAHHRNLATPENCVLAVYGDVASESLLKVVENTFGAWPNAGRGCLETVHNSTIGAGKKVTVTADKKQAVLVTGFPGVSLHSPERYALELLQESCSDLGSRLFLRVREKLGLAYYVGAQNFIGLQPGYFAFYAGTEPESADKVEQELLREAELLCAEGLSREELERAKAKLLGQRKIARQDLGGLAMGNALDELYGLGYEHGEQEDQLLEAVTLEDIQAVARKYLRTDTAVVVRVQPTPSDTSQA